MIQEIIKEPIIRECMWCILPATWEVRKQFPKRVSTEVLSCDRHLVQLFKMLTEVRDTSLFVVKER